MDDVEILRSIGRKSVNEFTSEDIKKSQKWAHKFYKELGTKSPFFRAWFGDWREYDKTKLTVVNINSDMTASSGKTNNKDTKRILSWSKEATRESVLNASAENKKDMTVIAANMSSVVENSVLLDSSVSIKTSNRKLEGTSWMHSLYSVVANDEKLSLIKLYAEEAFSTKQNESFTRAYSLKYIKKVAEFDSGVLSEIGGLTESRSTTALSISDLYKLVKKYDKDFKPISVNKALLNEDGTPKLNDAPFLEGRSSITSCTHSLFCYHILFFRIGSISSKEL